MKMIEKPKLSFKKFYTLVCILLLGAAFYPLWHFGTMVVYYATFNRNLLPLNVTAVVPFMGVFMGIFIGFLFIPLLRKRPHHRQLLIATIIGVLVFVGLNILAEQFIEQLYYGAILISARRARMPGDAMDYYMAHIPWVIRIHYYIFSIIFIAAVLHFLYSLTYALYGATNHGYRKKLVLHGVSTLCYGIAFFFVRVMQYQDFYTLQVTWGSVINTAICFMFGAIALGVFSCTLVNLQGKNIFIPPMVAVLTVVILYVGQYFMLGGNLYLYSHHPGVTMALRAAIAIVPGVIVYWVVWYTKKLS